MNNYSDSGANAVEKGLALFLALVEAPEGDELAGIAARAGVPISTAHRIIGVYLQSQMLVRAGNGLYAPGPRLAALARHSQTAPLVAAARLPLRHLARRLGATAHLGILEDNMVTYLVKEHGGGPEILTREKNQLEAYCSGIGKVLLAHLSQDERENYLANGPFPPLTGNTITDPIALRAELLEIRGKDYARDNAEVDEQLYCLAAPVRDLAGQVRCAISISCHAKAPVVLSWLQPVLSCARRIGLRLMEK